MTETSCDNNEDEPELEAACRAWNKASDMTYAGRMRAAIKAIDKYRALASAPSETVGRGEVVTGLILAAQMTLKRADSELQCAIDFEADGYALGAEKCRAIAEELDRLRLNLLEAASGQKSAIVNSQWNPAFMRAMTAKSVVIPTADRAAIREAMQGALDFIKGLTTGGYEHIVKLTATLGLIGEG